MFSVALPTVSPFLVSYKSPTHLRKGVQRVNQLQLRIASQRDHLVHFLQLEADGVEGRHKLLQAALAQALVGATDLGRCGVQGSGQGQNVGTDSKEWQRGPIYNHSSPHTSSLSAVTASSSVILVL